VARIVTGVELCDIGAPERGTFEVLFDSGSEQTIISEEVASEIPGLARLPLRKPKRIILADGSLGPTAREFALIDMKVGDCFSGPVIALIVPGMGKRPIFGAITLEQLHSEIVFDPRDGKSFIRLKHCEPVVELPTIETVEFADVRSAIDRGSGVPFTAFEKQNLSWDIVVSPVAMEMMGAKLQFSRRTGESHISFAHCGHEVRLETDEDPMEEVPPEPVGGESR